MHHAPAVSLQVVRSLVLRRWLIALLLLGLANALAALGLGLTSLHLALVLAAWSGVCAGAFHFWRTSPQGQLRWDGQMWHWSPFVQPVQHVAVQFDFQNCVWLTLQWPDGQRVGLWIDADPLRPAVWRAMRRAWVGATFAYVVTAASNAPLLQEHN